MTTVHLRDHKNLLTALLAARNVSGGRMLDLDGETVFLTEPLTLGQEDSGLSIQNGTLSGAMYLPLSGRENGDGIYAVPEKIIPTAVCVRENFIPRSVFPVSGRLQTQDHCALRWMTSANGGWDRAPSHEELTTAMLDIRDIPKDADLTEALITLYHVWDESTVRIDACNAASGKVHFATETEHPSGAFGQRGYVLQNLPQGMTPGRWYFDRKQCKIHIRPPESPPETIAIPVPTHLICGNGVTGLTLKDLVLTMSGASEERAGLRGVNCPGAVELIGCDDFSAEGLRIEMTAGTGIRMRECRNSVIRHCRIASCGACGIFQKDCAPAEISENTIENIGMLQSSAVGIHAGGKSLLVYVQEGCTEAAGSVVIEGNRISGTPYCAIACGGGPHRISKNKISRSMQVLHDGAAIYVSRARGTEITENEISGEEMGDSAYGIYFDEMSCFCRAGSNRLSEMERPFHIHASEEIRLEENSVESSGKITVSFCRCRRIHCLRNDFSVQEGFQILCRQMKNEIQWKPEEIVLGNENHICGDGERVVSFQRTNPDWTGTEERFSLQEIPGWEASTANANCQSYEKDFYEQERA